MVKLKCRLKPNSKQFIQQRLKVNKTNVSGGFMRSLATYPFINSLEILSHYSEGKSTETLVDVVDKLKKGETLEYTIVTENDDKEKTEFTMYLKYDSYADFQYYTSVEDTYKTREGMYTNAYKLIADLFVKLINLRTYNNEIPEDFYIENDIEVTVGDFIIGKELNNGVRMVCMLPIQNSLIKRETVEN